MHREYQDPRRDLFLILLGEQGGRRGQNARRDKSECPAPQETSVEMTVCFHVEIFLEEDFWLGFIRKQTRGSIARMA